MSVNESIYNELMSYLMVILDSSFFSRGKYDIVCYVLFIVISMLNFWSTSTATSVDKIKRLRMETCEEDDM